ncbi:MAG: hypothetical protein WAN43_14205 [Rhodomicrobium sp.]
MIAIPALLMITVAVTIGVYLGLLYLRRVRPRKILLGAHILLGMGGLEQVAILIRGAPSGVILKAGSFGTAAAGLFALAMLSGFSAPLLGQRSRRNGEFMLATHAFVGIAGFVLLLFWVSNF